MLVLEVKGGDLVASLNEQIGAAGVKVGAIASLIGAVDTFTVSTMPTDDASKDIVSTYNLPAEMHGSGEIVDGKVHLHATFAVQGDRAVAGHVHQAHVGHWFARAYVIPA